MNNLVRFLKILTLIPREPDSISTPDLFKKLNQCNYQISYRTLQRDLEKLSASGLFPLTSSENTNPLAWFWPKHAPKFQLPMMSIDEALVFKLVEDYLNPLLPASMNEPISHYFTLADATLHASPLQAWTNKVRIIPNSFALLPAEMDEAVSQVVYDAVLKSQVIRFTYCGFSEEDTQWQAQPLGLVFKGNVVYLVAKADENTNPSHFAFHRITGAELLPNQDNTSTDFCLDDYIRSGGFDDHPLSSQKLHLTLKVSTQLCQQLAETPISFDQRIVLAEDGASIVQASVPDSMLIRHWLHSYADAIEILQPASLRNEFAQKAKALHHLYQQEIK